MKTEKLTSNFLRQRILRSNKFLKMLVLILILFSIYSCAIYKPITIESIIKDLDKITDQNILYKVALETSGEVQIAAFNKITDQNLIIKFAIESGDKELGKRAINKVSDQNILYKVALEAKNEYVMKASLNKITDQNLINKLAIESKTRDMRHDAVNKVTDQNLLFKIAIEDIEWYVRDAAFNKITDQNICFKIASEYQPSVNSTLDPSNKVAKAAFNKITDQNLINKLVIESKMSEIRQEAVNKVTDQNLLYKIVIEDINWDVRKAAFKKLNDNSLDILTREANDPAVALSAKIRLGRISWNEAFSGKSSSTETLGYVIGAAAIVDTPQPTAYDVVSACHNFIKLGDASRIPELIFLLNKFGNVSLAEDYMNCGEKSLEDAGCNWGRAHGYSCTTGNGSNRVRWGSKK